MRTDMVAAGKSLQMILDSFEDKHVISLASRCDRRRRVIDCLSGFGIDFETANIQWFDGLVFSEAAGFPNIGVRGCFNSHFSLMRQCADNGRPMLVIEDDVDFDASALASFDLESEFKRRDDWDLIYFGYLQPASPPAGQGLARSEQHTIGGHFYAVQPQFAEAIATFMASCLTRQAGDPAGGPMYRDAAFNFYRKHNPGCRTWLATPSLAGQFSSRSDLAANPRFYDKIGGLRGIAELGRRVLAPQLKKRRSIAR